MDNEWRLRPEYGRLAAGQSGNEGNAADDADPLRRIEVGVARPGERRNAFYEGNAFDAIEACLNPE